MAPSSNSKVAAGTPGRDRVISLHKAGHKTSHIAGEIPVSQRSVQLVIRNEGLRNARTPALTELQRRQVTGLVRLGIARENVAAVVGCSPAQVRTVVTSLRGDIAPDLDTLRALLKVLGLAG
jgi:hypothetical protein